MLEKDWIDILAALLTPTIAIAGIYFAWSNHKLAKQKHKDDLDLAKKKRQDDLFDRRYELFEEISALWIRCLKKDMGYSKEKRTPLDAHNATYLVFKAGFLFDKEIEGIVSKAVLWEDFLAPVPKSPVEGGPAAVGKFPRELFYKYLNVE